MEQRRLRLGDILDDYCPRERRVTNHVLVAMIEEDIKQTRCATCDAEHPYKGGRAPRRKKSETTGTLYKEVLAGIDEHAVPAPDFDTAHEPDRDLESAAVKSAPADAAAAPIAAADLVADLAEDDAEPAVGGLGSADEGFHRPLIRAQLPRPEGLKIERQAPDFTMRHTNGRGGFRPADSLRARPRGGGSGGGGNGGGGNGNGGQQRFGRGPNRGRSGGGPSQGFSGGGSGRGPGGPRNKRGR